MHNNSELNFTKEEIEQYLNEFKAEIESENYTIQLGSRREKNKVFIEEYCLNEAKIKDILLSLNLFDFSKKLKNDSDNPKYKDEIIYLFGKSRKMCKIYGNENETDDEQYECVEIYIKINKTIDNVFIISFHKAEYEMDYPFKTQ